MRASWLFLSAFACGPSGDGPTDDDTDDTDTTDSADSDVDTDVADTDCSDNVPTSGTGLYGAIVDDEGADLDAADVRVQLCRATTCVYATCHVGDTYAFGPLTAGVGSYAVEPKGAGYFEPFAPITLEASPRRIDATVPSLNAGVAIPATAAEIEVAEGLYLTLGAGDLPGKPPLEPAPTVVYGIDATSLNLPIEGVTGEVVAVYYLSPFQKEVGVEEGTLAVRLDDRWTLGAGGHLWLGRYESSTWLDLGELTADGDGKLVPVTGIDRLSTLVVTRAATAR